MWRPREMRLSECFTDSASAFWCWLDIGAAAGDSRAGHSDEEYLIGAVVPLIFGALAMCCSS
jgi:hypothetical protein